MNRSPTGNADDVSDEHQYDAGGNDLSQGPRCGIRCPWSVRLVVAPACSMVGTARSPMVTTVAPTMPVDAPSKAPTTTTDMASPPRMRPKSMPHGVQQLLGQSGAFQHHPHKDEERHRQSG